MYTGYCRTATIQDSNITGQLQCIEKDTGRYIGQDSNAAGQDTVILQDTTIL
jgi:hypothetical protein